MKRIFASVFALVALTGVAHANETMDAHHADDTAALKRQVTYKCQGNKTVKVTYGFNQQKLPTYAQATLNGKSRFMPINLAHSDNVSTLFGDENNFKVGVGGSLALNNYHKVAVSSIQSPGNESLYKSCRVQSVKKLR